MKTRHALFLGLVYSTFLGVAAQAATMDFSAQLSGPAENPANNSQGTGTALVSYDPVTHMLGININFTGLTGTTTASHIHSPVTIPGGTAGVATTTPTFAGFPLGVTSGTYNNTLDLTLASSFNPTYVTAHGGSVTQAEADLIASIQAGTAYVNIHSSVFGGGEIRGFLTAVPDGGATALLLGLAIVALVTVRRFAAA